MKRKASKILAFCCSIVMFFAVILSVPGYSSLASTDGRTFSAAQTYQLNKKFDVVPQTLEAWISLPTTVTSRGGVILGNYKTSTTACLNFEIKENGNPRIYYVVSSDVTGDCTFEDVDVRSSGWTHIAFTWANNIASVYLNGEIKASKEFDTPNYTMSNKFAVGSDLRDGNAQYFKGAIKQIAVYSDVRTSAEIASDMNRLALNDSNIITAFEFNIDSGKYNDLTANGYLLSTPWLTENDVYIPKDYDFSFMAIGDTQIITEFHSSKLSNIYDYVLNNAEAKNVKHVFGLGDITNKSNFGEWRIASQQIARMDGVVNYSIVRGNHDIYDTYSYKKESKKR